MIHQCMPLYVVLWIVDIIYESLDILNAMLPNINIHYFIFNTLRNVYIYICYTYVILEPMYMYALYSMFCVM